MLRNWLICAFATLASLSTAEARQAATASPYVQDVEWAAAPSGDDVGRFMPDAIASKNLAGAAAIECEVTTAGRLEKCVVLEERPAGFGVGNAALSQSKLFRVKSKSGAAIQPGRYVIVPLMMRMGDAPFPELGFQPGSNASLLTSAVGGTPDATIGCATATAPQRLCYLHRLNWAKSRSMADAAPVIRTISQRDGQTIVQCQLKDGQPSDCKMPGTVPPEDQAKIGQLLAEFRAPETTRDKLPLKEASILVVFDWAAIRHALTVSRRSLRPRQARPPTAPTAGSPRPSSPRPPLP